MSRYVFHLPDVGEGIAEAEIAAWHVSVGKRIREDELLVDIMTDKATVDITSPVTGVVTALHGDVGQLVPVGAPLVEFEVESTGKAEEVARPYSQPSTAVATQETRTQHEPALSAQQLQVQAGSAWAGPRPLEQPGAVGSAQPRSSLGAPVSAHHPTSGPAASLSSQQTHSALPLTPRKPHSVPLASPSVRRRARELGITLESLQGSAAGERITERDLENHIASASMGAASGVGKVREVAAHQRHRPVDAAGQGAPAAVPPLRATARTAVHETRLVGLRRKIAERMQEAKRRIPHFGYVEELDMTELERLRAELNEARYEGEPKLTLLPFFMRAVVTALADFPHLNSHYDDEAGVLRTFDGIHIGIATQSPQGLLVPVVRHCEALSLLDAARELVRVTTAARAGKATREELTGSTITLTSLGALGGVSATPVINHPEVAIIGPNKLVERVVVRNGTQVIRTVMNVSSAFDHRIVDGHDAASFIQRLRQLLERPARLLLV